jgi:hypothetical protein
VALEEYLTETVEQSLGPVGAVGVEMIGRHVEKIWAVGKSKGLAYLW